MRRAPGESGCTSPRRASTSPARCWSSTRRIARPSSGERTRWVRCLELDDGACISESIAICRYFEELHPDPALFGSTPRERAEIEMWIRRVEHYLYLPIDLGAHFRSRAETREAAAEFAAWTAQSVRFLDRVVKGRDFLAGDRITMADVFAFGALDYGIRFAGFSIPDELSSRQAWYESMAARPSARA